ncbi:hypothetical protein PAJ34TS1_49430 [Paenibacillus azoreducens]
MQICKLFSPGAEEASQSTKEVSQKQMEQPWNRERVTEAVEASKYIRSDLRVKESDYVCC